MSAIRVDIVESESAFGTLCDAWNALEAAGRSVFMRHEWFAAAWCWRRLDARLQVLVARRDGAVIGVLPLVVTADGTLELLTVPDTQAADMLCNDEDTAAVAGAFAAALTRDRRWRRARFEPVPPDGPCARALGPAFRRAGMAVASREAGRNYCIDLSTSWKAYYDARSRSLKKAQNLAANRLARQGMIAVDRIGPDDAPTRVADALGHAIAISARSWKTETGNSLDQPGPQAFIRALTDAASANGWLEIWLLAINGEPSAMEYDIVFGGSVHALRADFVSDNVQTSPGAHLFRVELERLFERGLSRYYMGRGDNPYKRRWTEDGEPVSRMTIYNATAAGRAAWLREEYALPTLRRMRRLFKRADAARPASTAVNDGARTSARERED